MSKGWQRTAAAAQDPNNENFQKELEHLDFDFNKDVYEYLMEQELSGELPTITHFRSSQMKNFCPRKETLQHKHGIRRGPVNPKMMRACDLGNMYHEHLQNNIFGPMQVIKANWECGFCNSVVDYDYMPSVPCGCDPQAFWRIREMSFYDEETCMSGHIDGIIVDGKGREWILDFKTVKDTAFNTIKSKGADAYFFTDGYVKQQQIYCYLFKKQRAMLLYVNKENGEFCPWAVKRDDAYINKMVDLCKRTKALIDKDEIAGGGVPKSGKRPSNKERAWAFKCNSCRIAHARSCPYCKECFGETVE